MAERKKFEEMLERLVNEDTQGAKDLFHEIVVEKSRRIYESLLESDMYDEELDEDEDLEEGDELEEDEDLEEDWDLEEDFDIDEDWDLEEEGEFDEAPGADQTDDFMADIESGSSAEEMDGVDLDDRVGDLEAELDALKAEFEDMMADMDDDDDIDVEGDMDDMDMDDEGDMDDMDMDDMDMDMDDEGDMDDEDDMDDMDDEGDDEAVAEGEKSVAQLMREYTEKVTANMGDNGAHTNSPVAGSNNMGGTSSNIVSGGDGGKGGTGAKVSDMSTGNVNIPGGSAADSMKKAPKPSNSADSAKSMLS